MEVSSIKQNDSWAEEELAGIETGDIRLNKRAKIMLKKLGAKPNESIPNALNGWSELKAAYRFFDHEKVSPEKILLPHKEATIKRIKQEQIILIPQDTTQFHYSDQNLEGIGSLSHENETGFLNHLSLAVTPTGINLGVISSLFWARYKLGKRAERKNKIIEEKESYRWLEGLRIANDVAKQTPNTQVVSIADREGDIYELYEELRDLNSNMHFLVRVSRNRKLLDEAKISDKIWSNIFQSSSIGNIEILTPRNATRKSRYANLTLRTSRVTLAPPSRKTGQILSPVEVTIILAEEENPPKNETPIQWILLTDLEVNSLEEAAEKLEWYLRRWTIEVFFRILKTGCRVEELQLEHFNRLQNCITLYSIISWRIQMLIKIGKEAPDLPCDAFFETCEWQAAYIVKFKKPPPKQAPSIKEMCIIIAGFGGFIGRKSDGFPGAQTLWIGLQRTRDFSIALNASEAMTETTYG